MNVKEMVMETLGIDELAFEKCQKALPEIEGWYYWNPIRGGLSMIVNKDGDKLVANSSISFERHLEDFIAGRRN